MAKVIGLRMKLIWCIGWLKNLLFGQVVGFSSDKSSISEASIDCSKFMTSQLVEILQTFKKVDQQQSLKNLSNSTYYQQREVNGSLIFQPCVIL